MPKKLRDLKRIRAEVLSIRIDPKLMLATRYAAAHERRTVSSFVEWAIERAVHSIAVAVNEDAEPQDALAVVEEIWDDDEAKRLVNLALIYPELLTNEERALWNLIWFNTAFSKPRPGGTGKGFVLYDPVAFINMDAVRKHWETLKAVAAEKLSLSALPKGEPIHESQHRLRR